MVKKTIVRLIVSLLAFVLLYYVVTQYGLSDPTSKGLLHVKLSEPDFSLSPWIYVLYAHIVTACLAVAIGPFQLFIKPKRRGVRLHRVLGYLYVASIYISGLVSIYLCIFATGGWKAGLGFFSLDILWMASTWIAIRQAVKKNITAHREWMLRSYALTLAAVSFRVWLMLATPLFGDQFLSAYQLSAWLCWVGNLVFMELFIVMTRKKKGIQTGSGLNLR